ncbi:MAG: amidohydrolase family protein [Gammaproteobacteria bacterium]
MRIKRRHSARCRLPGLTRCLLAIFGLTALSAAADAETLAFVGANVVPMDQEVVLSGQTVLVRNGVISRIGPDSTVEVPAGAKRIDARDKYLLPGLAEMHAHIPGRRQRAGWLQDVLLLFVANGVTTARGMLGAPCHLQLQQQIASGEVLGPRIFTSGPSLNGNTVDGTEQARSMVEEQAGKGYDFLKLHPGLSVEEYQVIADTSRRLGMPFTGHVPEQVGLPMALASGQATIEHLDGYMQAMVPAGVATPAEPGLFGIGLTDAVDVNRIPELARETEMAGVWNVPTLSLIENFVAPEDPLITAQGPGMAFVPRDMLAGWITSKQSILDNPGYQPETAERFMEIRAKLTRTLQQQGAGLLLGSDAPEVFNVPGFSIHHELDDLVDAGLTPYQALRTGTALPAEFFGASGQFGTLVEGSEADMILVASNPLQDVSALRQPLGVMVRGQWLDREEIDKRLAQVAERYSGGDYPAAAPADSPAAIHQHGPGTCE